MVVLARVNAMLGVVSLQAHVPPADLREGLAWWHICEMVVWVREGHICEMVAWVREGHGGMVGERVWGAGWAAERPCLSTQSGAGCGAART